MDEQAIISRFEKIEKRLDLLEDNKIQQKENIKYSKEEDFSGLAGGIRLLIKNGFFNTLRNANEIQIELKREGYHHEIAPISKMLSVNFTKNKKILNRVKEGEVFKYALRK